MSLTVLTEPSSGELLKEDDEILKEPTPENGTFAVTVDGDPICDDEDAIYMVTWEGL